MDKKLIQLGAKIELARREFFFYCNLKAPKFYKSNRKYLVDLCNDFQDFYESDDEVLILNLPPRHGKSRTAGLFVEWVLGKNQEEKIMTGSYNETLSTMFSKNVRNSIQEEKADMYLPVYSDVFPGVGIKHGDGAMNLWSLEGGYNNYLATSPGGTATGFGASILLIDDLIKNAEEANNESVKEKHWEWFTNTMLSRLEEGGKIVIIMTRWASDDLAGRALAHYKEEGKKIKHINMRAQQDDGSMLCEEVLSLRSYLSKRKAMGEDIASANYQQIPIDAKGKLYSRFSEYEELPPYFEQIVSYTDTADEGEDSLCTIVAGIYENEGYVLDVYYTDEPMEVTEEEVPLVFIRNNVDYALVESNNGGKGFARNVNKKLKVLGGKTAISWFHQNKNKEARILTQSTWIMNKLLYPKGWNKMWPNYYVDMNKYQRKGKNKHDDAPDATTGLSELIQAYIENKMQEKSSNNKKRERRKVVRK